jgi:AraC-like DNA-binding protein
MAGERSISRAAVRTYRSTPREAHVNGEQPFWQGVGAVWKHLAGGMARLGFSFEWHEWEAGEAVDWAGSFHPKSIEICLNLEGEGWVEANGSRATFGPETAGFFGVFKSPVAAVRSAGMRHRFLSVEYSAAFLGRYLAGPGDDLHPTVQACMSRKTESRPISTVMPITHRHRELLRALLHPPVLRAAQELWYQSKALEFASEFFFVAGGGEPLCTRAQRLARERVARAKAILTSSLETTPPLEELGRLVGCSPFYLSRTFSQETGLTISQWLRRCRLERAAELLRSRTCNVTEAALRVGYSSLSHFSQAFHEAFGCCPGLYPLQTPTQRGTGTMASDRSRDNGKA